MRDTSQFGDGGGFVLHMCLTAQQTTHPPTPRIYLKNPVRTQFQNCNTTHIEFAPTHMEILHPALITTHKISSPQYTFIFPATMDDSYNSPFTYWPSPYYIPAHNPSYIHSPDYIHSDSIAGQLGLTPEELAPIEQKHCQFLCEEFAQPLTQPTTYHNNHTPTKPLPPPLHFTPPALPQLVADAITQLGITPAELRVCHRYTVGTIFAHQIVPTDP
jgi:hypothetical protein